MAAIDLAERSQSRSPRKPPERTPQPQEKWLPPVQGLKRKLDSLDKRLQETDERIAILTAGQEAPANNGAGDALQSLFQQTQDNIDCLTKRLKGAEERVAISMAGQQALAKISAVDALDARLRQEQGKFVGRTLGLEQHVQTLTKKLTDLAKFVEQQGHVNSAMERCLHTLATECSPDEDSAECTMALVAYELHQHRKAARPP